MKWVLRTFVACLCSVLFFPFLEASAQGGVIQATSKTIRVVDEKDALITLLYKDQQYHYVTETTGCYYVEIENAVGCISKNQAEKVTSTAKQLPLERTKQSVFTKKRAAVYDAQGQLIAMLEKNRRHYVVRETATDYVIRIGGREGFVKKTLVGIDRGIPVLMYHHLLHDFENSMYRTSATISPTAFKRQMRLLSDNDIQVVTTRELEQFLRGERNIAKNAVVITFDDGLKSNLIYAYPILKQYGYRATNFLITARVKDYVQPFDPTNLQFIAEQEVPTSLDVFDYEGHTHNLHYVDAANISYVMQVSREELIADLRQSVSYYPHHYFAYPFGQYDANTVRALQEVGYKMAFTTADGYVRYGDDLFQLKRKGIYPKMTLQQFKNIMVYE